MKNELKYRLATEIVMYHLEQSPTRKGRGFYVGTVEDMRVLVYDMTRDMSNAYLFENSFEQVTGKDVKSVVSEILFDCLCVFAKHVGNPFSESFFIHKDGMEDLRQRVRMDLHAAGVMIYNSYYKTLFLSNLLTADASGLKVFEKYPVSK